MEDKRKNTWIGGVTGKNKYGKMKVRIRREGRMGM